MSDYVQIQVDEGVHRITLARPKRRNALGLELSRELFAALTAARDDAEAIAIVLAGSPEAFCVGADMKDFSLLMNGTWGTQERDAYQAALPFELLWTMPHPVLSVVEGPCIGGGVVLVCASDHVIATPSATFVLPEVRWGFSDPALPKILPHFVGQRLATRMLLFAEELDAQAAERAGLVDVIASNDTVEAALNRGLDRLRDTSATARSAYKRGLRDFIGPIQFGNFATALADPEARRRASGG